MTTALYIGTIGLLLISFLKDKKKTRMALKKAWKAFENILPEFLVVIMMVGVMLAVVNNDVISKVIGADSGWMGVVLAALIGAITLIPGFIAFPTAALLLKGGAGIMQIAVLISTLMTIVAFIRQLTTSYLCLFRERIHIKSEH